MNQTIFNSTVNQVKSAVSLPEVPPQTPISCGGQIATRGIDTIHMTLDLHIYNSSVISYLLQKKKEVQAGHASEINIDLGVSGIFSWNLQRQGNKLYPIVLKSGDITFCLSTRPLNSTIPNAMLMVGSISCNNGITDLYKNFHMWCRALGIDIQEEKVSRIDIFADITRPIEAIGVHYIKNYVTRANYKALYFDHDELTGVQIGKSSIVCRIYDKLAEMDTKQRPDKKAFFEKIWGDKNAKDITRVEFQVRRAAIKEFFQGDTDYKTVSSDLTKLWNYLSFDWLRHAEAPVDRKNRHQDRSKLSEFWQLVRTAFNRELGKITRKRKEKFIDVTSLKKQARGVLLSIAAAFRPRTDDYFSIMGIINGIVATEISEYMQTPEFMDKFKVKSSRAVISF